MEVLSRLPPHRRLELATYVYVERHGVEKLRELVRWVKFVVARQEEAEEKPLQDLREEAKKTDAYKTLTNPVIKGAVSLDLLLYNDGDDSILDIVPGEMETAEDVLFRKELFYWVGEFLKTLPEKEAKIAALRLGVGCEPCSQQVISDYVGIRRRRMPEIEEDLFRKLRKFLIKHKVV